MRVMMSLMVLDGRAVFHDPSNPDDPVWMDREPIEYVAQWADLGLRGVDLVDLDGRFRGSPDARRIVNEVTGSRGVLLQVGGGIRTMADVRETLAAGAARICLRQVAMQDPEQLQDLVSRWPDRVVVVLETADYRVPDCMWAGADDDLSAVARTLRSYGTERLLIWDLERRSKTVAERVATLERLVTETGMRITAATDTPTAEEITRLHPLRRLGVDELVIRYSPDLSTEQISEALRLAADGAAP